MEKIKLSELVEFNDQKFNPKVLVNEPGYRMVLLNLRAKQAVPEHANPSIVTVYAVQGHITFYEGPEPCDLHAGEVVRIPAGAPHHLEAHEDSVLFILATGEAPAAAKSDAAEKKVEEIDVRQIPHRQRHPLIFQKFDALAVGESFQLVNDHDPVPLHMQIDDMRRGQAGWEYIERGPALFRIRIRRVAPAQSSDVPLKAPVEGLVSSIQ